MQIKDLTEDWMDDYLTQVNNVDRDFEQLKTQEKLAKLTSSANVKAMSGRLANAFKTRLDALRRANPNGIPQGRIEKVLLAFVDEMMLKGRYQQLDQESKKMITDLVAQGEQASANDASMAELMNRLVSAAVASVSDMKGDEKDSKEQLSVGRINQWIKRNAGNQQALTALLSAIKGMK